LLRVILGASLLSGLSPAGLLLPCVPVGPCLCLCLFLVVPARPGVMGWSSAFSVSFYCCSTSSSLLGLFVDSSLSQCLHLFAAVCVLVHCFCCLSPARAALCPPCCVARVCRLILFASRDSLCGSVRRSFLCLGVNLPG